MDRQPRRHKRRFWATPIHNQKQSGCVRHIFRTAVQQITTLTQACSRKLKSTPAPVKDRKPPRSERREILERKEESEDLIGLAISCLASETSPTESLIKVRCITKASKPEVQQPEDSSDASSPQDAMKTKPSDNLFQSGSHSIVDQKLVETSAATTILLLSYSVDSLATTATETSVPDSKNTSGETQDQMTISKVHRFSAKGLAARRAQYLLKGSLPEIKPLCNREQAPTISGEEHSSEGTTSMPQPKREEGLYLAEKSPSTAKNTPYQVISATTAVKNSGTAPKQCTTPALAYRSPKNCYDSLEIGKRETRMPVNELSQGMTSIRDCSSEKIYLEVKDLPSTSQEISVPANIDTLRESFARVKPGVTPSYTSCSLDDSMTSSEEETKLNSSWNVDLMTSSEEDVRDPPTGSEEIFAQARIDEIMLREMFAHLKIDENKASCREHPQLSRDSAQPVPSQWQHVSPLTNEPEEELENEIEIFVRKGSREIFGNVQIQSLDSTCTTSSHSSSCRSPDTGKQFGTLKQLHTSFEEDFRHFQKTSRERFGNVKIDACKESTDIQQNGKESSKLDLAAEVHQIASQKPSKHQTMKQSVYPGRNKL